MKKYVLGFAFDPDRQRVILIQKNRPAWQKGRLNGIGGQLETGESYPDAMYREFEEETGVKVTGWEHFATMSGQSRYESEPSEWLVQCYYVTLRHDQFAQAYSKTDETVIYSTINYLTSSPHPLSNISWLVNLARDKANDFVKYQIYIV